MTFPINSQEELDPIINKALAPRLSKIAELESQVETLTTERDEAKNQVTAVNERAIQLEADVKARERDLLVKEVAHKKGVREKWLSGDTEEELMASADEYLADAKATLGVEEVKTETGDEGPKPGTESQPESKSEVVPSAGTGDETPAKPTYHERMKEAYEKAREEGAKGVTI